MKKTFALIATGSLVAMAAPALAQSSEESPFTGLRVGGTAGYDNIGAGSSVDDDSADRDSQDIDGIAYGVEVGYDVDTGGAVFGVEGEFAGSTADAEFREGQTENFGFGNVSAGRDLYVGLRAGLKATANTLVYAKGGYTNTQLNLRSADGATEFRDDIETDGYRVGAGVEHALNSGMYLKGEYRYSNYSSAKVERPDLPDSDDFDVDLDRHQVMASVGWRF